MIDDSLSSRAVYALIMFLRNYFLNLSSYVHVAVFICDDIDGLTDTRFARNFEPETRKNFKLVSELSE